MRAADDPAQGLGDTVTTSRQHAHRAAWGIRFRNRLLHDGRCNDIPCAVRAHDGQGAAARNAFNALSSNQPAQPRPVHSLALSAADQIPLRGTAGGRDHGPRVSAARGFLCRMRGERQRSPRQTSMSRSAIFLSRVGRDRPRACAARAFTPRARRSAVSISARSSASTLLASDAAADAAGAASRGGLVQRRRPPRRPTAGRSRRGDAAPVRARARCPARGRCPASGRARHDASTVSRPGRPAPRRCAEEPRASGGTSSGRSRSGGTRTRTTARR